MKLLWENIEHLSENKISYLLFLENKSIYQISKIRNLDEEVIKFHIYEAKKELLLFEKKIDKTDILSKYLSLSKLERENYLKVTKEKEIKQLLDDITKCILKTNNIEDLIVIIWTIGELKIKKFNDNLKYYSSHPHGNVRRITYSAMGKIADIDFLPYLSIGMKDSKPQVKQYAILAFGKIAKIEDIYKLNEIYNNKNEKEYVRRAAKFSMEIILDRKI